MNIKTYIERINPLYLKGVCHRGLHGNGIPENSMRAFRNAIDHNMAFEFDVHLTKDNEIVISHDANLKRMTKKEGIIEELTLKEIKTKYKLPDGSTLPTLDEVLALCNEQVPIVLEVKVPRGQRRDLRKMLAIKIKEKIACIKDKKNICIISFDAPLLLKFKGYMRQFLVTVDHEWTWMFRGFFEGVDLEKEMLEEKRVQRYAKNHFVNIWTVETVEQYHHYKDIAATQTFQYFDPNVVISGQSEKYNIKF